jgi:hypothetical protein
MEPAKAKSDYQFFIFNVQNATEYFVEANGVRSETFKLDVADVPFVKQLNLTLSFPSYTRLAAQTIEDGGDITALKGTVALVTAQLTGKAKAARIVLRDGRKIEMRGQGETNFIGALTVTGDSSYHIELVSIDGDTYSGSNEHDITLLEDQPPTVAFEKPGRDTKATSVEEVFTQVKAEDDYGVSSIEMFFSVNGGAEQKINLQKLSRDAARAMSGVHTFFLEEHGLKPGDFISYYAKARDAANEVTSDIYFVEVKPFDMQYKQAQQQGGGGGGGGGEEQNALTKRQKELIAATFRLMREAATTTPKERADNYNTVATGQERLRNDAREFVERIRRRLGEGMEGQEELAQMVEHLNEAAREMEVALPPLKRQTGKDALPAEQRALQNLLRADAIFREMQVASGNQEGGGGQQQQSEELTDLFELELDKMKNQYETLNREGRQQAQQGKDEATRKLEELARRQQQALEQQQRRQQSGQPRNGGGGGGSQRQQQELIEETRKAARELERLSRERRDPRMQELSRQLNQAADDMQKAQAASESGNGNEAAEQNRRALERLEAARQRMGKSGQANRGNEVGDLRQRAAEAAARQREITKDVEEMARRRGGDAGKKQQLAERKDALADALNNLEQDVEQAARAQNDGQGGARTERQLRDAAASLRRNRVADRVRESKQKIENDQFDAARADERAVQQSLNEVTERLQSAEGNAKRQSGSEGEEALDGARQLADNLESLRRRLGENSRGEGKQQTSQANSQRGQQQGQQERQQQGGQQQGQQRGQQQGRQGQQGQQGEGGQQGSRGEQQGQSGQGSQRGGQQGGEQQGESGEGGGNSQSGGLQELRGRSMGGGSGGDSRQLGAELRERLRDAEDLRRQIGSGELARELDEAMAMLKKLAGTGMMQGEAQTAALLKAQVIDPLRQIELELSRRLQAKLGRGNLRLGDEGSAPERYRKSVDEYYKRLSSRGLR